MASIGGLTRPQGSNAGQAGKMRQGFVDPAQQSAEKSYLRTEKPAAPAASARVQLSSLGRVKSALAETQAAAGTLVDARQPSTPGTTRTSLQSFVSAYNKSLKTLSAIGEAKQVPASSEDKRIESLRENLQQVTVKQTDDLKRVGITRSRDGSLNIDLATTNKALEKNPERTQAALQKLGQEVERVTTPALKDGPTDKGPSSLGQAIRDRDLEGLEQKQLSRVQETQQIVEQQDTQLTTSLAGGLASYQRTFSA